MTTYVRARFDFTIRVIFGGAAGGFPDPDQVIVPEGEIGTLIDSLPHGDALVLFPSLKRTPGLHLDTIWCPPRDVEEVE